MLTPNDSPPPHAAADDAAALDAAGASPPEPCGAKLNAPNAGALLAVALLAAAALLANEGAENRPPEEAGAAPNEKPPAPGAAAGNGNGTVGTAPKDIAALLAGEDAAVSGRAALALSKAASVVTAAEDAAGGGSENAFTAGGELAAGLPTGAVRLGNSGIRGESAGTAAGLLGLTCFLAGSTAAAGVGAAASSARGV